MNVVRRATPGTVARIFWRSRYVAGPGARPFHPLQDRVGRVLQRQVDVLADLVALGHGVSVSVVIVVG